MTYPDGSVIQAKWVDDKLQGSGKIISKYGAKPEEARWNKGVRLNNSHAQDL
jgi:hypothetical protein